jgi:hypothetical protein
MTKFATVTANSAQTARERRRRIPQRTLMSIKQLLTVVCATVGIHLAAAARPQLSYPVIPVNLCGLNPHLAVGVDGSVLLRRNVPADTWPVDQLCSVHLFDDSACDMARKQVSSLLSHPLHSDDMAWIAIPAGNFIRNQIGRITYNNEPLLLVSAELER